MSGGRSSSPPSAEDGWVRIGVVTRPHGVRGGLRLHLDNPHSDLLAEGLPVQLRREVRGEQKVIAHTVARVFGVGDRLELEGVTSREAAEALRGTELCVHRDTFPAADDDESYLVDLIGVEVHDADGAVLGVIEAFADNGAQPLAQVMVGIRRGRKRYVELPLVPELVVELDEEAGVLVVDPPQGLFSGEAEVAGSAADAEGEAS
jgi:16S rRNA processing protein RimM